MDPRGVDPATGLFRSRRRTRRHRARLDRPGHRRGPGIITVFPRLHDRRSMTSDPDPHTTAILVPIGALGMGVRASDVAAGLAAGAHAIACDAGSSDSGPAYLATGLAKYSRDAVKTDLAILMRAQASTGIPLLIGSCGTSGSDARSTGRTASRARSRPRRGSPRASRCSTASSRPPPWRGARGPGA